MFSAMPERQKPLPSVQEGPSLPGRLRGNSSMEKALQDRLDALYDDGSLSPEQYMSQKLRIREMLREYSAPSAGSAGR